MSFPFINIFRVIENSPQEFILLWSVDYRNELPHDINGMLTNILSLLKAPVSGNVPNEFSWAHSWTRFDARTVNKTCLKPSLSSICHHIYSFPCRLKGNDVRTEYIHPFSKSSGFGLWNSKALSSISSYSYFGLNLYHFSVISANNFINRIFNIKCSLSVASCWERMNIETIWHETLAETL